MWMWNQHQLRLEWREKREGWLHLTKLPTTKPWWNKHEILAVEYGSQKKVKLIKLTWTPFPPTKKNNNDSLLEKTSSYGWWFRNPNANHPTSMKPVVNNGINGFQPQLVFSPDFWIINRIINRQLAGLRRSILWGFARRLRHHVSVSRRRLTHEPCILPIYENHKNPTKKRVFFPIHGS